MSLTGSYTHQVLGRDRFLSKCTNLQVNILVAKPRHEETCDRGFKFDSYQSVQLHTKCTLIEKG